MVEVQSPSKDYSVQQWLWDYFIVYLWSIYDSLIHVKNKLYREDVVGRSIKIMSPSERRIIFSYNAKAGGYSSATLIKLFSDETIAVDEDSQTEILNHEILHQVLREVCGVKTCRGLDKIIKVFTKFNCDDKKWYFEIVFISKKTGKIFC